MTTGTTKVLFTVEQFEQMAAAGIFADLNDRVELVDGEVVEMASIGLRHMKSVNVLTRYFVLSFAEEGEASIQNAVRLDRGLARQPDIALFRRRPDLYAHGIPSASDVILLVEVGDTSAQLDRREKMPEYGRAGIPELWLVDLERAIITVCLRPVPGGYESMQTLRRGDYIAPSAFPDRQIAVTEILGEDV
jgi:Uma2 family endonuclease